MIAAPAPTVRPIDMVFVVANGRRFLRWFEEWYEIDQEGKWIKTEALKIE